MAEVHIIRLRGPWELQPLVRYVPTADCGWAEQTQGPPAVGRVGVPGDWESVLGRDFLGCVRYTRHFNRPTNLDPAERVWLVFERIDERATVALNGQTVSPPEGLCGAGRLDVTSALQPHNVLSVDVTLSVEGFDDPRARPGRAGMAGGLPGEVRLEIGGA